MSVDTVAAIFALVVGILSIFGSVLLAVLNRNEARELAETNRARTDELAIVVQNLQKELDRAYALIRDQQEEIDELRNKSAELQSENDELRAKLKAGKW